MGLLLGATAEEVCATGHAWRLRSPADPLRLPAAACRHGFTQGYSTRNLPTVLGLLCIAFRRIVSPKPTSAQSLFPSDVFMSFGCKTPPRVLGSARAVLQRPAESIRSEAAVTETPKKYGQPSSRLVFPT